MTRFSPGFIFPMAVSALASTYHGEWRNAADSSVVAPTVLYTFAQATHGINTSNDKVYITVTLGNSLSVSDVTVNGVSAALQARSSGNTREVTIWSISHAGGDLGPIRIFKTDVGTASHCGIAVYSATGGSAGSLTASATGVNDVTDPFTYTLDIPAGGLVIMGGASAGSNPGTVTWTNVTNRYNVAIEGSNYHFGASQDHASAIAGATIQADTANNPGSNSPVIAAVFPP